MDIVVLTLASIVWGAVLVGAAMLLQATTSLAGAGRQMLWRIAAVLLVAPWIAAPLADLAGIGLPAAKPVIVEPAPAPDVAAHDYDVATSDIVTPVEPAVTVATPVAPAAPIPWVTILVVVIAAGWAWRLVAARIAARSLKRIVAASAEAGEGPARQSLTAWSRRLKFRQAPSLRIVASGLSPFSFGIVRPVICLPEGLDRQLDREALDLVVAHECLHTARGDGWLRPVERIAADLLWFNPFAWRIRRELDVARELACDEAVLKHVHAHRAYAHTLRNVASIAAGLGAAVPATSMSLSGSPRSLMLRMRQALAGARTRPAWSALAGVALFGVAGTLAACMQGVAAAPRVAAASTPAPSVAEAAVTPEQPLSSAPIGQPAPPLPIEVAPAPQVQKFTLRINGNSSSILDQPARLTADFGYMPDPFTGKTAFHAGVDLAASWGAPIFAPTDGVVSFAGIRGTYGRVVELDLGDGVAMRFGHLNAISVKAGMKVKAGDQVGTMGSTGRSTGPHVHVEYLRDGKNFDPREVENLTFATSLEIDLQATEPALPTPDPQVTTPPPSTSTQLIPIQATKPVSDPGDYAALVRKLGWHDAYYSAVQEARLALDERFKEKAGPLVIVALNAALMAAEADRTVLSRKYAEVHPEVQAVLREIAQLQKALAYERGRLNPPPAGLVPTQLAPGASVFSGMVVIRAPFNARIVSVEPLASGKSAVRLQQVASRDRPLVGEGCVANYLDVENERISGVATGTVGEGHVIGFAPAASLTNAVSCPAGVTDLAPQTGQKIDYRISNTPRAVVNAPARPTSGFGVRMDPFTRKEAFHGGTDVAAYLGAPIHTPGDGVVSFAGVKDEMGNVVELDVGGGYMLRMGQLAEVSVKVGDRVKAGDVVGTMGSTGRSTGPHLHLEVLLNGKQIDPELIHGLTLIGGR